ncbi:MAG: pilus assembly protein TadG-related protein [Caldilineaceae bacterium]
MMIKRFLSRLVSKFLGIFYVFRQEEGISMVYLALTLMTFLSLAGLAIDGSQSFAKQRELQTAADAAALAGARALALDQNTAQVTSEVQTIATLNGADSATSSVTNDDHNVSVTVQRDVNTYFAKLIGFPNIAVTAQAEARYFSGTTISPPIFPMTVECDCVEQNQTIQVTAPIKSYCVDNVNEYNNGSTFALWLADFDPLTTNAYGSRSYFHTTDDKGRLVENADGTASLSYTVKNAYGDGFKLTALLSARQSKAPTGSPKFGPVITDATNWYYYKSLSGKLTGLAGTRYAGSVINISRQGPAFQVGTGADYHEAHYHGGAAWLNLTTAKQPTTGVYLPWTWNLADINVRLPDCTELDQAASSETTNSCEFQWLDWNGGTSSQSELTSSMQDLSKSGTRHIGEWVSLGVNANGGVSLEVQNTFHNWLGLPATIPLYTGEISESNQVQICGFAQMVVSSSELEYGINHMSVQFQPAVIRSETVGDENGTDYGVRDVVLIR